MTLSRFGISATICSMSMVVSVAAVADPAYPDPQAPIGQPPLAQQQVQDPPSRVGRLSYTEGTVSFHNPDDQQWSPAQLNYPVTNGNAFWTEPNAKTEIQVGGTELRMDQSTELDVTKLDDNGTVFTVPQGVINVHLNALPPGGIQIETPGGEVNLIKPGSYHIDSGHVDPKNPNVAPATNQVMVFEGEAQITTPNSDVLVMPGENAIVNTNPPSFSLVEGNSTPFDDWALSREKREMAHQTPNYVSPAMTGYEDLDAQGAWQTTPDYGPIWYPQTVAADWAPYRYGHWAYVSPWGWTWIDDAPWGFAPFHYGRWVQFQGRWGWTPGERVERPVYAPALVAFVGGNGFDVSISLGRSAPGIGWVPLAPHEVFHPYYAVSVDYARRANINYVNKNVINNITVNNIHNNITENHFANARAATVVPANSFAKGAPVHKSLVAVPASRLAAASAAPDMSHFTPTREARIGGGVVAANVNKPAPAPVQHQFRMPQSRAAANVGVENRQAMTPSAPAISRPQIARPESPATPQVTRPEVNAEQHSAPGPSFAPRVIRGTDNVPAASPAVTHDVVRPEVSHPEVARPEVARPEVARPEVAAPSEPARTERKEQAEVKHPEQHGQITPTPKGWQRTQQQQAQPHAEEKHEAPAQSPQGGGERRDGRGN